MKQFLSLLSCFLFLVSCADEQEVSLIHSENSENVSTFVVDKLKTDNAISIKDAEIVVKSFLAESLTKNLSRADVALGDYNVEIINDNNGEPIMYVFNMDQGGFIVIGSSRDYFPILAFSDEGSFDISKNSPLSVWLEEIKAELLMNTSSNDSIKLIANAIWNHYEQNIELNTDQSATRSPSSSELACWNRCDYYSMNYGDGWEFLPLSQAGNVFDSNGYQDEYSRLCYSAEFNHSALNSSVFGYKIGLTDFVIGPLIATEWHQRSPYNDLCDNCPAGCGAIAVAQLLNYYKYPSSFQLNNYTFTWNDIATSNQAKAALVRLAGLFTNTHYFDNFSYVIPNDLKYGLEGFLYNVTKQDHDYNSVKRELREAQRPVIMLGHKSYIPLPEPVCYMGDSHYWICDGLHVIKYDLNYFTEWQPYGNGSFVNGAGSFDNPNKLNISDVSYFHMNWGNGHSSNNGWFIGDWLHFVNGNDDVNYQYSRQDYFIQHN